MEPCRLLVKLRKQYAYTANGKDYHKWAVNLPPEHVEALGWEHGQELEAVVRKEGILLRPAKADD